MKFGSLIECFRRSIVRHRLYEEVGASPCDKREELALQICFGQIQCQIGLVSVFGFSKWSKEERLCGQNRDHQPEQRLVPVSEWSLTRPWPDIFITLKIRISSFTKLRTLNSVEQYI